MNKQDLVNAVHAEVVGVTRQQAAEAVDVVINVIRQALSAGESVRVSGLGTFELRERPAREGRNPATGERIQIPARIAVGFRPAKALRETVNS